jgi:hypothetical protein
MKNKGYGCCQEVLSDHLYRSIAELFYKYPNIPKKSIIS